MASQGLTLSCTLSPRERARVRVMAGRVSLIPTFSLREKESKEFFSEH